MHKIKTQTIRYLAAFVMLSSSLACTLSTKENSDNLVLPELSVQLWSVKDDLKRDFKGTLKALSEMGFTGVEFAGDFGEYADKPKELKKYLDSLGLKASGAHVSFDMLRNDKLEQTIEFYKDLNCNSLIVPYDERAWNKDEVINVVNELNLISQQLAPYNMQTGFHNHQHEFDQYGESTFWDFIAKSTLPNVILQQDVGWTNFAGKDPVEYVRRYPGRTLTTHYKATLPDNVKGKLPIIGFDKYIQSFLTQ